ncbi:MAG: hypothetical protein M3O70_11010 [Actinomycetota bacterium]|nr:hypothetical protein [Actinomycetota bacterium]
MERVIVGRVLGGPATPGDGVTIGVVREGPAGPDGGPVVVGADGRFALPVPEDLSGALRLRVTVGDRFVDVAVDDVAADAEVVVVLPEAPTDPRDVVADVGEVIRAEREALTSARTVLGTEVAERASEREQVRRAVDRVLSHLAASAGGDLAYLARSGEDIARLTGDAVGEARAAIASAPPASRARSGVLTDGQQLPSAVLLQRLSGVPPARDGFWWRDPAALLRLRQEHQGPDGLPRPRTTDAVPAPAPPAADGSTDGGVTAVVEDKAEALVEAIRLPEDPPLLVADSAVTAAGPEVTLASGIADVTAFHDFHQLVLAMPHVWHEVFDRHFVGLVEAAFDELVAAGVDIGEFTDEGSGTSEPPTSRLLSWLSEVARVYQTTSAARIHGRRTEVFSSPAEITSGVVADGVVFARRRDDDLTGMGDGPPPGGRGGLPPGGGGPQVEFPSEPQEVFDDSIGSSIPALLRELESYLKGKHAFTVYAADGANRAINFAVLLTWRQLWEPLAYQTGGIAHTMTLSPGERRKIATKRRRTLKRFTAEAEKSQRHRTSESIDTNRAESEILRKATATTNFQLTSEGSTKLLVADGSFTTSTTRDVGREGDDTRRRFRESVMKAAQEFRDEHSIEVKTESEDLFEEETTAEFHNPNDELAVTAVFYTLQRRYRVKEHLYRARPVILVAMSVPDPGEITTAWLIRHAWIIRRSLLDARFVPALDYLTTSFLGDSVVLADLRASYVEHRKALVQARHRYAEARLIVDERGAKLHKLRTAIANADDGDALDAILSATGVRAIPGVDLVKDAVDMVSGFLGGDDEAEKRERAAALLEAEEEQLIRAEREAREAETQLAAASSALQQATREYVRAKRDARNHEVRTAELRVHVSDNILHYLQAIWASTPPDQLFFELHTVQVPVLDDQVRVTSEGVLSEPGFGGFTQEQFRVDFAGGGGEQLAFRSLAQVADLDQLLGFKGNYAMFPMKAGNALTDVILAPFLDEHEILRDPDDIAASWTLTELEEYADRLRDELAAGRITQQEFDDVHVPFLRAALERILTDPRPSEDIVVVPTDSLYAELLTSGRSLIEPFKKEHRSLDVAQVRAENRRNELENLRVAARIATGELADPDMDDFERHLVRGDGTGPLPPPSPSDGDGDGD